MAVFYKYVDRESSDQIDWGAISKSMSDTLDAENKRRDEKKQAIDDASRKYINELQNQPQTQDADVNKRLGQFANDGASFSKMLLDDLKSGRISLQDYTIRTQNLIDDTKVSLDLLKVYGERSKFVKDGINKRDLSAAQADLMAQYEGFSNLKNNKLYVDPASGRVYAANEVMGADGVKTIGDNIRNVTALKQMMQQDIDLMDADGILKGKVGQMGDFTTSELKSAGFYLVGNEYQVKDAKLQEGYKTYVNNTVDQLIGGDNNPSAISFFYDNMRTAPNGKPYRMVYKEEDVKEQSDILVRQNDNGIIVPVIKKDSQQYKDAAAWINQRFTTMIDENVKSNAFTMPEKSEAKSERESKERAQKDRDKASISAIANFYQGDAAGMAEAESYFKGLNPEIKQINKTADGLNVIMNDGKVVPIPMVVSGRRLSGTEFIKAATFLTKVANVDEAIKLSEFDPKKPFNASTYSGAATTTKAPDYNTGLTTTTADGKVTVVSPTKLYTETTSGKDKVTGRADFASQVLKNLGKTIDADQIQTRKVASITTRNGKVAINSLGGGKSAEATYIKIPNYGDIVIPSHIPDDQTQQIIKTIYQNVSDGKSFDPNSLRNVFPEYDTYNSFFRGSNTGRPVQSGVATSGSGGRNGELD
jgi:hypothetical protein